MRFYPQLSGPRARTIALDAAAVLLIAVFAWSGIKVHDTVIELNALSRGVTDAGQAVNGGFDRAADAVGDVPLVGGALRDGLRGAGGATGGNVAAAGRAGESAVSDTARLLGWVTFGLPTLVLLAFYLPLRAIQVRRLSRAHQMLGGPVSDERRRLLAMRAAFGLSWSDLASYTQDPIGDLEAGRLDPLVAALYADAGMRPPAAAG
ncbi:MAG: hypothetical protein U0R70_11705 [Solirubrobacteraceae bacterium]